MRLKFSLLLLLLVGCGLAAGSPDSKSQDLAAEHRSAKPEAFLDRIKSALFGSSEKSQKKPLRPKKQKPLYKPPPYQQAQPSHQTPIVATRPQPVYNKPASNGYGAPKPPQIPVAPTVYQPSASNTFPSFFNGNGGQSSGFGGVPTAPTSSQGQFDPWQVAQPANMAQIRDLQVQCEKDLMRVRVEFDRPFYGVIFSKGHYSDVSCVHVPAGLGQTQATFDIALRTCGMSTSVNDGYSSPTPQGSFIENTVIIQYDPLLQEVWDQARKLRCTWYDFYEKAVTFKPYQVDMLDPVTANFLGDNLRCWMQIQVGKGPHASEVSGIVKIGQTMTMVLGVKDDENKFDMMVRNCVAHDGQRSPIQLVDEKGCVSRPKIMSPFKKIKNFDATANVLAYAYFQAFKFPDSMNVHFQCVVQVCRGACPEPQCGGASNFASATQATDDYGSPQAPTVDSYGSPQGNPIGATGAINPRLPLNSQSVYQPSGSERRVTIVKPDGTAYEDLQAGESVQEPERIELSEPGYELFSKRSGALSLGGRPRSLEPEEEMRSSGESPSQQPVAAPLKSSPDQISASKQMGSKNAVDAGHGEDAVNVNSRHRRDANGNRILHVVRRDATDMADVETEKVIQVIAPNDVQFALSADDKEEVVINTNSGLLSGEAVCIDTPAFVGVTISFLMILIIALITIVFLWMRIRSMDKKALL